MKMLLIEDNERLAERIKQALGKYYVVDLVHTGEDGISQSLAVEYNIIVLDLGLPDLDGLQVCKKIRAAGIATPILILTATDDIQSRVRLLDSGADDYVTKPFNKAELGARISALIRRQSAPVFTDVMLVHDLQVDVNKRVVRRAGIPITLRRKEFDILEYLVANRGRPVTRAMIMNHAWADGTEGWNNTVDVHIKHLRDKVDKPFNKSLIKTAYGIGYMVEDAEQYNAEE